MVEKGSMATGVSVELGLTIIRKVMIPNVVDRCVTGVIHWLTPIAYGMGPFKVPVMNWG